MKKILFILAASALLAGCNAEELPQQKEQFCGNVIWATYDISTNSANVTLDNGSESKVIKVSPPKQYSKGEYICL